MLFDLVLKNAKIVTPEGVTEGSIGISAGKIAGIGEFSGSAAREIDCSGKYILPGAIDCHVHFRDPGLTQKGDFETESRAAVAGGVTTVIDMPNTKPPTLTCKNLEQKREIAGRKSHCNYGFYMGFSGENFSEIEKAKNIAGVKIYMGSSTGNLLVEDLNAIEKLLQTGKLVIVHAESEKIIKENEAKYKSKSKLIDPHIHSLIRSHKAAFEAIKTILHLAKKTSGRVHVTHMSTADEVSEIQKFKSPQVSCDTTPHHLFLNVDYYGKLGNFVKVNPPLRDVVDQKALWEGIKDGVVDCIASDHAPHTKEEKEKKYWDAPSGVPGVQTILPLMLDAVNHGELALQQAVKLISENPAKFFKIRNKGKIEVGFDADLTVVDMELKQELTEKMLFYKCGWSPYAGFKIQGWPVLTLINGKIAFEKGKIIDGIRGNEVIFG